MKSRLFLVIWRVARVTIDTDMTVSWAKMLCYSNCCFTHHCTFAPIVSVSIITLARCPINFKCKLVGKHKGIQKVLEESQRGLEVWREWLDLNLTERKKRFPSWAGAEKICSGFEFQQKNSIFVVTGPQSCQIAMTNQCHQPCPCCCLELSCLCNSAQINPLKQWKNTKTQWNTSGLGSFRDG